MIQTRCVSLFPENTMQQMSPYWRKARIAARLLLGGRGTPGRHRLVEDAILSGELTPRLLDQAFACRVVETGKNHEQELARYPTSV